MRTIIASLRIRQIDNGVYVSLKKRAVKHGISVEEEVRRILKRAVMAPERLGDLALESFGASGVELERPRREPHEPMPFEK